MEGVTWKAVSGVPNMVTSLKVLVAKFWYSRRTMYDDYRCITCHVQSSHRYILLSDWFKAERGQEHICLCHSHFLKTVFIGLDSI